MKYEHTTRGRFVARLNRFVAEVEIDGRVERVHVKNTGRLGELLLPGALVILEKASDPNRKTAYDLVGVLKEGLGWVNIDSQASNRLMKEWLESGHSAFCGITKLKPEFTYRDSRVDFYLECGERKILIEVKGCTLEREGIGYFPDAPTERGVKHLHTLQTALNEGYEAYVAFVIAMPGITEVRPNRETHPAFGAALDEVTADGVRVLHLACEVGESEIRIIS